MAIVRWNSEGLDSIIRHDSWRLSHGWEPMAAELMEAVEAYFKPFAPKQPPRFMPGRRVKVVGVHTELRITTVQVRSKPFRVYFRYRQELRAFEVLQVLHPRAQYDYSKRQL